MLHQRTWAEVDLSALERNLDIVRQAAGPGVDLMLVVKADAYGHGAVPVAWHLAGHGVACFGVGDSTEALELRDAGITSPILVLGAVVAGEVEDVIRGDIAVTVHSGDRVRSLRRIARVNGGRVTVHLKVDTGMGRLGCKPDRAVSIAKEIRRSRGLRLEGIATHLAGATTSGGDEAEQQLRRFRRVLAALAAEGIEFRWRHAYASNAVLSDLGRDFNLVRPGLAVYGIDPHGRGDTPVRPVLAWRTQIVFLKDHRRGARIGYGGTFTVTRRSRVATIPVGYNDGYRFAFSNRAEVLVRGQRCPIVGRVSMDYACVDVTRIRGARVGDVVTLIGGDQDASITVEELAELADTIPYEILCGIGRRVKRRYLSGVRESSGAGSRP
ncbi:MAG: alanine racemase [Planctomycetota bacterium]|jgi:alanine racemase